MELGARGQSEVLGTALLLGITVISIALVVSIAGTALDSTRDTTDVENAEHAMSQLDSRAALVALGRTDSQSIDMGRARSGSYRVDEDAGWIRITHLNYTPEYGDDQVIYNELEKKRLGAIIYQQGDRTVAYQGGGVWRSDGSGGSVLVSPPEFHYRGETLTIPIIQVREPSGGGGASGDVSIHLSGARTETIFPNESRRYENLTTQSFSNPVQNGSIQVTVKSDYYQAWASFFRSRTAGNVTVDATNQTVTVKLTVPSIEGEFQMPLDGDSMKLRIPRDDHAINDLNLTIAPDDADSAQFSNLKWSLYAEDGSEKLELHIRGGGNAGCDGEGTDYVQGTVYYTNGSGTYQGWTNESAFPVICQDWDGDDDKEARVVANWSKPIDFNYTTLSKNDLHYFNPSGTLDSEMTFTGHPTDELNGEPTVMEGSSHPVGYTVSHYGAYFGPVLELTVADAGGGGGSSGSVSEEVSTGRVHYGGDATSFVTYVHATENRVNVTVT